MSEFTLLIFFLLVGISLSFRLQVIGNKLVSLVRSSIPMTDNFASSSKLASADGIFEILKNSDKGANLEPSTKTEIDNWINSTSASYLSANPEGALADPLIYGNYEVSYVGTGKSQRGNPAGGRFRGAFGRILYKNEGLFQNILNGDGAQSNATVVVNGVHGKALGLLPLAVILRGVATKLSESERSSLSQRYGTQLSAGTVRADFEPPLLCIGSLTSFPRLSVRIGPSSSVVLDTPYVDNKIRLGVGSRGSTFIFRRTVATMADDWKGWMAEKPLRAKPAGAVLFIGGVGLQLLEKILQIQFGVHVFNSTVKLLLTATAILGGFMFLSKGGIVD